MMSKKLIIGYDEGDKDESCLTVGVVRSDGKIRIINTLYGKEAEETYKTLCIPKTKWLKL